MIFLVRCDEINGCGKTYPGDLIACPHCETSAMFSSVVMLNPLDYVYDIETYPNIFTCCFIHLSTNSRWRFEISNRINQIREFCDFLTSLINCGARLVGYNNVNFDYPIIHYIFDNPWIQVDTIYAVAMAYIKGGSYGEQLHVPSHNIYLANLWPSDRKIDQLDLMVMCHYDFKSQRSKSSKDPARATSLKSLEFAMRMKNLEDLPFELGVDIADGDKDELHRYNEHDCVATAFFYVRCLDAINLRKELTDSFHHDFTNYNEVKIGKTLLTIELKEKGIECYERVNGKNSPRQTHRPFIDLSEVIFPYVNFENSEFDRVKQYFQSKVIEETKGVFKQLHCTVEGLEYHFGTGGLHASISSQTVRTDTRKQLVDVDVASYYPNLSIKNKLFPKHLGEAFCDIQLGMYETRKTFPKSDPRNGAYKLALNGAFGGSNDPYSPFYDPFYTMSVTINGQLMLCMLVEQLVKIPGLTMVQANTDGVTFLCPHEYMDHQRSVCKWWENLTCLELEEALYSRMHIRDVNNYMAVYESGDVKRIGAFAYITPDQDPSTRELVWHKDHSALIVPKAVSAALLDGVDIREFITNHTDPYDFMLRAKVPRTNDLVLRYVEFDYEEKLPTIIRYFISTIGGSLIKIAPPTGVFGSWKTRSGVKKGDKFYNEVMVELSCITDQGVERDIEGTPHSEDIHTKNKSKHAIRETGISSGWRVIDCSDVKKFDKSLVDYEYYIAEAKKLVDPLR